ncbi:MAG: hypothetical protein RLZZ367_1374 [Bacteroidota bacterium]|jgi:hypothetical protein
MRNKLKYALLLVVATVIATACQEKIDLKLKNGEPQVVIEANLSDQPGPHYVIITKSVRFDDSNNIKGLSGAQVIISDDAGNSDTLVEAFAGLYATTSIQGVIGRTYHLQATVEGTTYEAYSYINPPVDIDSIIVKEETDFGGETKKNGEIQVQDPGGVTNYYRVISFLNGDQSSGFDVHRDRLWDGKLRTFNVPHSDYKTGDTLTVNLLSITEKAYTYFDQFNQNSGNFGAPAAPANPDSYFTPSALGYFSAHSVKTKTTIVQ